MHNAKIIAVATEKRNKENSTTLEVMEMKYKVKDNVLWITDHRGHLIDFDLDIFDVEIKTVKE